MVTIGQVVLEKQKSGNGHAPLEDLRPTPPSVAQLLRGGGVALIVGGRTTNWTEEMRRHPQLLFWDSTDPKTYKKDIPSNTRAILITRFTSHGMEKKLRDEAKRRGIAIIPGLSSTGDVRAHLQPVVDHVVPPPAPDPEPEFEVIKPTPPPAAPVVVAQEPATAVPRTLRPPARGELRTFIIEQADRTATSGPKSPEVQRLLAGLRERGISSTPDSISQAIRMYIRDAKQSRQVWAPAPAETAAPPVQAERPPVAVHVPAVHAPAAQTDQRPLSTPDQLLEAVIEAERYCDDMKAAADLLGSLLPRLRKEIERFREQQRRARELFQLD